MGWGTGRITGISGVCRIAFLVQRMNAVRATVVSRLYAYHT